MSDDAQTAYPQSPIREAQLPTSVHSTLSYRLFRPHVHLILRVVMRALAPNTTVTGRHHIPRRGAVIFTPNHLSDIDSSIVSAAILRPLWWMAKRELFSMRVVGPVISWWQTFPVDRDSPDRAALRYAEQLLRHGHALNIFPEGRIAPTGEMGPVLPGVALLALRTKVPVIPVGLSGTPDILPFGQLVPRPTLAPVHVHFGAPLDLTDVMALPRNAQREAATRRLEEGIRRAVGVARGE